MVNGVRDVRSMAGRGSRGFTLIEMMVVISIILILLGIAMPIYSRSLNRAKEDVFRQNLDTLNEVIFQYTLDKQKAPKSLDDLKSAGYIESVPPDITGQADTWVTEEDESIMAITQTDTGIVGVHSGSSRMGSDGKAYSEW
jgi:general secretion pathway protein G